MGGFCLRFSNAYVHCKGKNLVSFRSLPEEQVSMLRQKCRENNVTMPGPLRGHRIDILCAYVWVYPIKGILLQSADSWQTDGPSSLGAPYIFWAHAQILCQVHGHCHSSPAGSQRHCEWRLSCLLNCLNPWNNGTNNWFLSMGSCKMMQTDAECRRVG